LKFKRKPRHWRHSGSVQPGPEEAPPPPAEGAGEEPPALPGAGTVEPPPAADPDADWVPPRNAVPFGPFLAAGALEWLWLQGWIVQLVPGLSIFR